MEEIVKNISSLVIGGVLGYFIRLFIEHRLAIDRIKENIKITEFNKGVTAFRACFAPQLAYLRGLRSTEGSNGGVENIREYLYSAFIQFHASELEKFRFYIKSKEIGAYEKACEDYEHHLYPGYTVDVGDREPSEFFIAEIEKLLEFAK